MPKQLKFGAYLILGALAVDFIAWTMGHTLLHPVAMLAAAAWIVAALMIPSSGQDEGESSAPQKADGSAAATPNSPEASPAESEILRALTLWSEAVALASEDEKIIWANPAWGSRHGVTDPVGKKWSDFHSPDDYHRWRILLDEVKLRHAASGMLDHRGSEPWTSRASLVTIEAGQKNGGEKGEGKHVFMVATYMTADEAALRQQTREIGHSLNNVLSAVVGNVGLAIETPGIDKDLQSDLREAETGALRAAELVHGLQALARGDA